MNDKIMLKKECDIIFIILFIYLFIHQIKYYINLCLF